MTIHDLLDKYEPKIRRAFIAGLDEITSNVRIVEITKALERGNISDALDLMYIEPEAYKEFEAVLREAYGEGGDAIIEELGALKDQSENRFVFRFNARDLAAEKWLRDHSSELITNIVQDQRQAVKLALNDGMTKGQNPRTVALDIVGRINKRTKRRTGGLVGLNEQQANAVLKAREQLLSGDYSAYLRRSKRDKRFDRTITKAKREDKPLTQAQVSAIVNRYSDRLLKLRGDTIARTEALSALHASQYEAIEQLIKTGKVTPNQVTLMWDASRDARTRIDHMIADGQLIKWGERFKVGGKSMKYPSDPAGGANQVINCRCAMRVKIKYGSNN